jgi:hypothetical protein
MAGFAAQTNASSVGVRIRICWAAEADAASSRTTSTDRQAV